MLHTHIQILHTHIEISHTHIQIMEYCNVLHAIGVRHCTVIDVNVLHGHFRFLQGESEPNAPNNMYQYHYSWQEDTDKDL